MATNDRNIPTKYTIQYHGKETHCNRNTMNFPIIGLEYNRYGLYLPLYAPYKIIDISKSSGLSVGSNKSNRTIRTSRFKRTDWHSSVSIILQSESPPCESVSNDSVLFLMCHTLNMCFAPHTLYGVPSYIKS